MWNGIEIDWFYPFQKCLEIDWLTCTAIKNYKWQSTRGGNKIDSCTNRFASARNPEKTKIRLACLLVSCMWNVFGIRFAIRKNRKHLSSFSDSQHQLLRLHSDSAADVNRNQFPSIHRVLNGKEEESTSNFLRHHVIKVCKLSELFKYLFILSAINAHLSNVFIENIFEFNWTTHFCPVDLFSFLSDC